MSFGEIFKPEEQLLKRETSDTTAEAQKKEKESPATRREEYAKKAEIELAAQQKMLKQIDAKNKRAEEQARNNNMNADLSAELATNVLLPGVGLNVPQEKTQTAQVRTAQPEIVAKSAAQESPEGANQNAGRAA